MAFSRTPRIYTIALVVSLFGCAVCLAQTVPDSVRQLVNQAISEGDSVLLKQADERLLEILVEESDNAEAYYLAGLVQEKLNQPDPAISLFELAIEIEPAPEYLLALGKLKFRLGRMEEALRIFAQALQQAETREDSGVQADVDFWLGQVYEAQKDTTKAIDAYRAALQLNPDHPDAVSRLQALTPVENDSTPTAVDLPEETPQATETTIPDTSLVIEKPATGNGDLPPSKEKKEPESDVESAQEATVGLDPPENTGDTRMNETKTPIAPPSDTTTQQGGSIEAAVTDTATIEDTLDTIKDPLKKSTWRQTLSDFADKWAVIGTTIVLFLAGAVVVYVRAKRKPGVAATTQEPGMKQPRHSEPNQSASDIWGAATVSLHSATEAPLPEQIDRYRIAERLGSGGVGVVHKAYDTRLNNRIVAVKFLRLDSHDEKEVALRTARFERAWRILAKLDHPNIVKLLDRGEIESDNVYRFYIAMEYVEGLSVDKMIEREGTLELDVSLDIIRQTLLALDYAHRNGVIHRDLKPSNIMRHKEGWVKVLDFDIAKVIGGTETQMLTGEQRPGTFAYMSPEQVHGGKIDHRTDIFSLGLVLYEMLLGRLPDENAARVGQQSPEFHQHRPELPPALNSIVMKMLALNPADRYQSAREVWSAANVSLLH